MRTLFKKRELSFHLQIEFAKECYYSVQRKTERMEQITSNLSEG